MANKWKPLQPGDLIDLIAPGFPCSIEDVQNGVRFIESMGYRARVPSDLFGKDIICSNTAKARFQHLKKALQARDSKVIWCLRGGYGSIQFLPNLANLKKPSQVKLFWGYSDATTLHVFFNQKWNWPTIHGPLLDRLGSRPTDAHMRNSLQNLLSGESQAMVFEGLRPMNSAAKKRRQIKAPVIGGNMTVLASSVGTPWAFKAKKRILFLEDTGERAYRIDRMLQQFHQSGAIDGIAALILGDFLGAPDKDGITRVPELWEQFAKSVSFPVLSGVPAGHGEGQMPVPLNTGACLSLGLDPSLACPTGI